MAKQLNPMPPSAKTARRAIWVQAVLVLLLGGAIWYGHEHRHAWIPDLIENDIYRTAAGLGAGALGLLFLTFLMRYQWRWVWLLLLLIEVACLGGLIFAGIKDVNWWAAGALGIVPLIVLVALLGRVSRRWFHH